MDNLFLNSTLDNIKTPLIEIEINNYLKVVRLTKLNRKTILILSLVKKYFAWTFYES